MKRTPAIHCAGVIAKKCTFLAKINFKNVDTRVQKTTIQKHSYSSSDVAKTVRRLHFSTKASAKQNDLIDRRLYVAIPEWGSDASKAARSPKGRTMRISRRRPPHMQIPRFHYESLVDINERR